MIHDMMRMGESLYVSTQDPAVADGEVDTGNGTSIIVATVVTVSGVHAVFPPFCKTHICRVKSFLLYQSDVSISMDKKTIMFKLYVVFLET